jgi:hypothetical protein
MLVYIFCNLRLLEALRSPDYQEPFFEWTSDDEETEVEDENEEVEETTHRASSASGSGSTVAVAPLPARRVVPQNLSSVVEAAELEVDGDVEDGLTESERRQYMDREGYEAQFWDS